MVNSDTTSHYYEQDCSIVCVLVAFIIHLGRDGFVKIFQDVIDEGVVVKLVICNLT